MKRLKCLLVGHMWHEVNQGTPDHPLIRVICARCEKVAKHFPEGGLR